MSNTQANASLKASAWLNDTDSLIKRLAEQALARPPNELSPQARLAWARNTASLRHLRAQLTARATLVRTLIERNSTEEALRTLEDKLTSDLTLKAQQASADENARIKLESDIHARHSQAVANMIGRFRG